MENQKAIMEDFYSKAEKYTQTNVELIKLKTLDKISDVIPALLTNLFFVIIAAFVGIMLNIALAIWIGESEGAIYLGFIYVASFYAVVGIVLYIFRNTFIKNPLSNSIIIQMQK